MGQDGRRWAVANASPAAVGAAYDTLIEHLRHRVSLRPQVDVRPLA